MLFNSYIFIFVFLPMSFGIYYGLLYGGRAKAARVFLVAASLTYYAWWKPVYSPEAGGRPPEGEDGIDCGDCGECFAAGDI